MLPTRSQKLAAAVAPPIPKPSRVRIVAATSLLIPLFLAAGAPDGPTDAKQTKTTFKRVEIQDERATTEANRDAAEGDADRVALSTANAANRTALKPDFVAKANQPTLADASPDPIARAIQELAECRTRFEKVKDYTCTFYKRERIDGVLSPLHVMDMKMRTDPQSIYLKFHQPNRGREAIYVAGRNNGLVLAHDVGFTKLLAGTMRLDPHGARAMEGNRHPITKAGIGALIETIASRWTEELHSSESVVVFDSRLKLGSARCLLIETIHPEKRPNFVFHKVRLFINTDLGFPVRFEGYDWPKSPNDAPELVEEYVYDNIKLNVGLDDSDFDVANELYSFGRF